MTWLVSWNPIGERGKSSAPPGGISLSQVMASTNGGQRLIVSSSRILIALKACVGIALSQPGRPNVAATGGGSFPSSPGGQRNLSVIGSLLLGPALALSW